MLQFFGDVFDFDFEFFEGVVDLFFEVADLCVEVKGGFDFGELHGQFFVLAKFVNGVVHGVAPYAHVRVWVGWVFTVLV